jgi:chorismate mutase/prephenate dehydratase
MSLDEFRAYLDTIDTQLMTLLSQRAQVVLQVADYKRQHNLPVYVPEREEAIVARLRALNPGPLSGEAVARIYQVLIEEMRKFEGEHLAS